MRDVVFLKNNSAVVIKVTFESVLNSTKCQRAFGHIFFPTHTFIFAYILRIGHGLAMAWIWLNCGTAFARVQAKDFWPQRNRSTNVQL